MKENIRKALLLINPSINPIKWDQSIKKAEELENFKGKEWAALRRRYLELMLNVHPDKTKHLSETERNATNEKTKEYNGAYSVLEDAHISNELWEVIGTLDDFDEFSSIPETPSGNSFKFSIPRFSLDTSKFYTLSGKANTLSESEFLAYLDSINWKENLF